MTNKYKNLWHKDLNRSGVPEYYENNAKKIGEHREVEIFDVRNGGYDFVFKGACVTQRAGATDFKKTIDDIFDGKRSVATVVKTHIVANGKTAKSYDDEEEENLERCPDCGHTPETGACFYCKQD